MNLLNAREYIENLLYIRTKEGTEIKLKLKPAQEKLYNTVRRLRAEGKPVRVIVLKARQMGFSTLIAALIFHACASQENRAALMVAHQADATANLYAMHRRFYDRLPLALQPMRASSNAIEMIFANPAKDPQVLRDEPGLRSRIRCATAGGEGVGRSDTLQYVHASEYAFWPDGVNRKSDALLGILQAVPDLPGTMVFIESTANGFEDFKKRWDDAVAGRSDFVPVFFGWNEEPGYRREVPPGTVWTEEEKQLAEQYDLSPEQLAWRRWCLANNCGGDPDKFRQEYPICPEEAFISTGSCWFDTQAILSRLRELESQAAGDGEAVLCEEPRDVGSPLRPFGAPPLGRGGLKRGAFTFRRSWDPGLLRSRLSEIRFTERENGPVTIWTEPEDGVPYVLGGDTAGEGSDAFAAYVIDNTTARMCACIWQENDEAGFTEQVYCLGLYYKKALIGLEVNFSTYPTAKLQELGYPKLYVRQTEDSFTHETRKSFGFRTDSVTRPAMLSELRETVEAHPEIICDPFLLREMLVFVKDKNGRPSAVTGEHDDRVMAFGITLKIRSQQSAAKKQAPGKRGAYTEDMLEDYRAASPELRAYLESIWGKP